MSRYSEIKEAYVSLGLQEGCTLEAVKAGYKQAALRTHPDKNPDNPDATAEFQRVGEAYRLLVKHLGHGHSHTHGFDYEDYDDDYDSDEDFFHAYDEYEDFPLPPFVFFELFERLFRSRGTPMYHMHRQGSARAYPPRPTKAEETPQQYKERLERTRKEQVAAQERREREAKIRKEARAREREEERLAAEKRQKQKLEEKKAKAESQRKKAEEASRLRLQKSQRLRTEVFQAAREGNTTKVKEGIWEHSVDATGGEVQMGCEDFISSRPKDLNETLLHIATKNENIDLVKWLDSHGADMEERNSQGFTVLHTALRQGRVPIVKYIVETYPPGDEESIYEISGDSTLLSLAMESKEPELVWVVLENKLALPEDINKAWNKATSESSVPTMISQESEKHSDIIQLLKTYGGFTPPATPHNSSDSSSPFHSKSRKEKESSKNHESRDPVSHTSSRNSQPPPPLTPMAGKQTNQQRHSKGRGRGRGRGRGSSGS